ncbi:MAG: hypothetical protein OQK09_12950 [Colwellia sp.]|nr:hypothetical protein [Colwellia sp.]MCW8864275.1 hypothetical protein [Colwellia sp.]MCW9082414.1 hypothetical protein [Colwellia sp.]
MKSIKILLSIIFAVALTGCVTPIPLAEQTPKIAYKAQEKVVISVVDNRKRIKEGKPKNYVGKAHASFGIPVDWHVNQVLATEDGDKDKNLSQFLEHRLTTGLSNSGWNVVSANLDTPVNENNAKDILTEHDAQKMLVLDLQEWYFSINLNWVTAFNFDTDTTIYVYEIADGKTLEKEIKERDVIEEKASESPQNNVLRAYRDQLIDIFNDEEVKKALTD